ncbi:hypothetical protein AK812_SmicGene45032 [Symbiodinium microadriaticum]|uniref:DNA-directed DNA polymerase n=1 Tax=Symbiodinium microadriaticum TaxID=2951 RepID=A0A1Q9BWY4_SYMMI|nr:hypothetical protein AK812_SmicGene45032 [Symbiodinium microadriaticum]
MAEAFLLLMNRQRAVPLDEAQPVEAAPAVARIRSLNPRSNTFWIRQIFFDAPPGRYLSVESLMLARESLQDLLTVQLPFMVKIIMHIRLSEEIVDPVSGERETVYSERRIATVPMLVRPLADPGERLRRYVVATARKTLGDRLEHARFNNSLQKFEGIIDMQVFTTPSRELAQLPAAPGGAFLGGCWKELPALLQSGKKGLWSPKNSDHQCFRYCVTAEILGCREWSCAFRKQAAMCNAQPFYDAVPRRGRPSKMRRLSGPVDVHVNGQVIDFSMLPPGSGVTFEDIEKFESGNAGLVEVYVYQWSSVPWVNDDFEFLMPVRSPSLEGRAERTVLLLLHDGHYVLIYDFNKLSSCRSPMFAVSQQANTHDRRNRCHRCMANFKSQEALGRHLSGRVCSQDPGKRQAQSLRMPVGMKSFLYYKAGPSAAMHPCVCYADFETFNTKAPQQLSGQSVLVKQDRVASFAYMAVGRCGFEIPPEHRLRLERASEESGEFGLVEYFLHSLLALAAEYNAWRKRTNVPCQMTPDERERFDLAETCEICGERFLGTKVLHHEHGTGKFLAAACFRCNLGIRMPTTLPIYLHNGASYDFHFVLRFLAHENGYERHEDYIASLLGECGEGDDFTPPGENDPSDEDDEDYCPEYCPSSEDPWGCDLSKIKLGALVKSGEKCLMLSFGPLRFLDSLNVFPTSLASLIDDNKASCSNLSEAFPLLSLRHPIFAAAELDAPERRSKAWELLLKKIPMPFDALCDPACWTWEALLPREAYDNLLTGEKCSEEKYQSVKEIVDFFGFRSFADFHDAYLCTDLALADVMERYRDTFWEHFHLDPCQYVYELIKTNIRGGLGHIAQPFALANHPGLPDFDPARELSWILFYDVNSMYPSIMEKPLPIDGGEWRDLPSSRKERLRYLNELFDSVDYERDDEEVCYMVEVTFDVPWFRHSCVDWAPVCKMPVKRSQLSPYSQSLIQEGQVVSAIPKLVPYLGVHAREVVDLRYLKFIAEHLDVRVFDFHSLVTFRCSPFMKSFVRQTVDTRREYKRNGRKLQAEVQKLTVNVQYGKMVQNQENFRSTRVYTSGLKFQRAASGPDMLDIHPQIMEEHAFLAFVDVQKAGKANVLKSFLQGGWKVLEESRLLMMKAHYRIRRVFDGDLLKSVDPANSSDDSLKPEQSRVRWLGGDTDSSVLQIFADQDPKIALAKANLSVCSPFFDVAGDAKGDALKEHLAPLDEESRELALRRAGELGNFSDELAPHYGIEWVGLAPKMYSLSKTEGESKERAKGVPKSERKKLDHDLYRAILECGGEHKVEFRRLGCRHHVNEVVEIHKRGLTALNTKTWQLDAHRSRPLGHFKNNDVWAACWTALQRGRRGFEERSDVAAFHLMNHILSFVDGEVGFLHRVISSDGRFKGELFNTSYLRSLA